MSNDNTSTSISKNDLKTLGGMTAADFSKLTGEKFAGLRILHLEINEAAGPFRLTNILRDQELGEQTGKKKMKPVDVYVAMDSADMEIRMPVAASFVGKAKDSNLAIGDEFCVLRAEDYISKDFGTKGKSYLLTVTKRSAAKTGKK